MTADTMSADVSIDVFFSHTFGDRSLVTELTRDAAALGVNIYTYEEDPRPGEPIAPKLQSQIEKSDAVIALLTHEGAASSYVQQEIGFAIRSGKLVVPLVETGVHESRLGKLAGIEYIPFIRGDIEAIRSALKRWLSRLVANAKATAVAAAQHKQGIALAIAAVILILFVVYLSKKS